MPSLVQGWKPGALPLDQTSDDTTAPFPIDATSLSSADDIIPATAPLILYRLLVNGTTDTGNRLRTVDKAGTVEITF